MDPYKKLQTNGIQISKTTYQALTKIKGNTIIGEENGLSFLLNETHTNLRLKNIDAIQSMFVVDSTATTTSTLDQTLPQTDSIINFFVVSVNRWRYTSM